MLLVVLLVLDCPLALEKTKCSWATSFPPFPPSLHMSPHLFSFVISLTAPLPLRTFLPAISPLVLEERELAPAFNRDLPVMKPLCLYSEPTLFRN